MSEILNNIEGNECHAHGRYPRTRENTGGTRPTTSPRPTTSAREKISLNFPKCKFSIDRVNFLGQVIDGCGIKPDPDRVKGIQKMAAPTDASGVRQFLGVINQMSKFIPNTAEITQPLRELGLGRVTGLLTESPILALYNPYSETVVSAAMVLELLCCRNN